MFPFFFPSLFVCLLWLVGWSMLRSQVDVSGGGGTRATTAAAMVDRMLQPENFILMLDENRYGPVNAVLSSVRKTPSIDTE